jgi:hypothetical protein
MPAPHSTLESTCCAVVPVKQTSAPLIVIISPVVASSEYSYHAPLTPTPFVVLSIQPMASGTKALPAPLGTIVVGAVVGVGMGVTGAGVAIGAGVGMGATVSVGGVIGGIATVPGIGGIGDAVVGVPAGGGVEGGSPVTGLGVAAGGGVTAAGVGDGKTMPCVGVGVVGVPAGSSPVVTAEAPLKGVGASAPHATMTSWEKIAALRIVRLVFIDRLPWLLRPWANFAACHAEQRHPRRPLKSAILLRSPAVSC